MIIDDRDQEHQYDADPKSDQLFPVQIRRGVLDSDQSAVVERTDQRDQKIIKFSKGKGF